MRFGALGKFDDIHSISVAAMIVVPKIYGLSEKWSNYLSDQII